MDSNNEKFNSLQVLRLFAFVEIFLFHCGCKIMTGGFGVSIFFVLSGFLYGVKDTVPSVKYVLRKIGKLYPLHLICIAVGFALLGWTVSRYLVYDFFLIQSWAVGGGYDAWYSYNGVAWYLSTYMFVLLFSPISFKVSEKIQSIRTGVITILLLLSVMFALAELSALVPIQYAHNRTFGFYFTYICPLYRSIEYTIGVIAGKMQKFHDFDNNKREMLEAIAAFILSGIALVIKYYNLVGWELRCTLLFTPASIALVWMFSNKGNSVIQKIGSWSAIKKVAALSGYMFLTHQMIIGMSGTLINKIIGDYTTIWYGKFVVIAVSFIITWISAWIYRFCLDGCHRIRTNLIMIP